MKHLISALPLPRRTLVLGALASATLPFSRLALAQQKFINVLTGGQSGVYYPMGVALSQIYGKAMPDAVKSPSRWPIRCLTPGGATRTPALPPR